MVRWTAVVALVASGQAWAQDGAPSPFSGFEVGIGLETGGERLRRAQRQHGAGDGGRDAMATEIRGLHRLLLAVLGLSWSLGAVIGSFSAGRSPGAAAE